jgi:hypothetical protein
MASHEHTGTGTTVSEGILGQSIIASFHSKRVVVVVFENAFKFKALNILRFLILKLVVAIFSVCHQRACRLSTVEFTRDLERISRDRSRLSSELRDNPVFNARKNLIVPRAPLYGRSRLD